jgi:hypothetical protein
MGTAGRLIAVVLLIAAAAGRAQEENKEMRTMKLRLKEAKITLDQSKADLTRADASFREAKALFTKGLYSKKELDDAEDTYNLAVLKREQAGIDLEKTRLAFLNDALHVTLEKAALYRDADGHKHALLTIKNSSNIKKIIDEEGAYNDSEKRALLSIDNMVIRIMNEGSLIGRPFEYRIPSLSYNQARQVDFVLQRETESVSVHLTYGDTLVVLPVFLEKEAKEDRVQVDAVQFSQEGELGTRISYEFELERFVDDNTTFSLEVLNLPGVYTHEFQEMNSEGGGNNADSRVSRIRFKKGVTTKTIRLYLNMPKEIPKEQLNEKVTFFVLVLDRFAQQRLAAVKAKRQGLELAASDLDSAAVSYELLELLPRGRAEITISASMYSHKVNIKDPIKFTFNLQNTGTIRLDRIRVYLSPPVDWTANAIPLKDISLDVEQLQKVDVEVLPSADVVAADYDLKIEARTLHEGREIEASSKIMRIQVEGKSNFLVGAILMILLIGMIIGVAVMTIKISRR